ncbi:MAG: hypothetical protein ACXWFQ_10505, partial [Thermoanaerobaculia bacterium]
IGPPVAPPEERSVEAWTEAIERALLDVTLNADDWEDHELVAAVNALYGERIRKDFLEGEERKGGELSGSFQVPPGGIARLRAMRDALVAECDRLAGVFRRASDNPAR